MRLLAIALTIGLIAAVAVPAAAKPGAHKGTDRLQGAGWIDPGSISAVLHVYEERHVNDLGGNISGLPVWCSNWLPNTGELEWNWDLVTFGADTDCGRLHVTWTRIGPVVSQCAVWESGTKIRAAPADVRATLDGEVFEEHGWLDENDYLIGANIVEIRSVKAKTCP